MGIIEWSGYSSYKTSLASLSNSFVVSVVSSYNSFAFHTQYLLDKQRIGWVLKLWMISSFICMVILCALYIVDDALIHETEEIGFGQMHNFHIAMFVGHTEAKLAMAVAFITSAVEAIYFGVLLFLYVDGLKQMKQMSVNIDMMSYQSEAIKGVILIILRSI